MSGTLRGIIRRPDRGPLGSEEEVLVRLSEAFPGVRFQYEAEEPPGMAVASDVDLVASLAGRIRPGRSLPAALWLLPESKRRHSRVLLRGGAARSLDRGDFIWNDGWSGREL